MNNEKTIDRRRIKTQRAIHTAYLKLLKDKPADDISIQELADLADISRKTFYNYYDGIWEIEEDIENSFITKFRTELKKDEVSTFTPHLFFNKLLTVLNSDQEFFTILFSTNTNSKLLKKIATMLFDDVYIILKRVIKGNHNELTVISQYLIAGSLLSFQIWYNLDENISVDEFSKLILQLIQKGVNSFIA